MKESEGKILPAGPLMKEHRLIERMINLVGIERRRIEKSRKLDTSFITTVAEFIKKYTDECHHGKEEDILFRRLEGKDISKEHSQIMQQLISEHKEGRKVVIKLLDAKDRYEGGDKNALTDAVESLKALEELYPKHIEKEDKHFFLPCMDYFSRDELDEMLQQFAEFDKSLIHKQYRQVVERKERG